MSHSGTRRRWFVRGHWYFLLSILTLGLFAWVPFLHAGARLERRGLYVRGAIYGAAAIMLLVLTSITPTNAQGNAVGTLGNVVSAIVAIAAVAITAVACVQLVPLRREVYGLPRAAMQPPPSLATNPRLMTVTDPPDPAVAAVLAGRMRRQQARELAIGDPLMARELLIGRPDLGRTYNDGGLVDLNGAPAAIIAQVCQVELAHAQTVVSTRERLGGAFLSLDDAFTLTDVPPDCWDRVRDRAILLPRSR